MPPRDEQDYEQRRQQIIDGALAAFSAKGFDGASNKDIAQAAKIASPGLIYHYFKDKLDLLHQLLESRMPLLQLLGEVEGTLDRPPAELLPVLALKILRAYEQWPAAAIMKVVLAESMRNPQVARMVNEVGPGRGLRLLSGYLAAQMDAGALRRMDPDVATRAFVGPLIAYSLTKTLFDDPVSGAIGHEAMARGAAEIFLRGMAPEAGPGAAEG
jgi:AcrR family transcriptional regulator